MEDMIIAVVLFGLIGFCVFLDRKQKVKLKADNKERHERVMKEEKQFGSEFTTVIMRVHVGDVSIDHEKKFAGHVISYWGDTISYKRAHEVAADYKEDFIKRCMRNGYRNNGDYYPAHAIDRIRSIK